MYATDASKLSTNKVQLLYKTVMTAIFSTLHQGWLYYYDHLWDLYDKNELFTVNFKIRKKIFIIYYFFI